MTNDERPGTARRDNPTWPWIIIAAAVVVVALIIIFFFLRPGDQEVVAPGDGVEVADPENEVEVAEPADDVDAVPATVEEGAWVSPGLRYVVVDGVEVRTA